ncbi:MAG: hypothetical protein NTY97_05625 [Planctomycetota bacterium]|nr:hypothetical protein [Planctomycetota bacterium]
MNANAVEYVIVGGVALAHHGLPRYTGDFDVLIHATPGNASRVMQALKDFGLASLNISQDDFSQKDRVIQLDSTYIRVVASWTSFGIKTN